MYFDTGMAVEGLPWAILLAAVYLISCMVSPFARMPTKALAAAHYYLKSLIRNQKLKQALKNRNTEVFYRSDDM